MAVYRIEYYSDALRRMTSFEMFIPNDPRRQGQGVPPAMSELKTLFLLHGYTGRSENWIPGWMPERYGFAIVSPTAENSCYLNREATGGAYETMVGVELPDYVHRTFGLARSAEDTFIAGVSMGGFGALHLGLKFPERFGKIGAMSAALIVHGIAGMKPGEDNGVANYDYYRACFGDLDRGEESEANPEVLVDGLLAAGKPLPAIWQCCGAEDFLIEPNRAFHRFLAERGVPHVYEEGTGKHDMVYWQKEILRIIPWMFGGEADQ